MLVIAATARPQRDMKRFSNIDFDAIVVSNGARVVCGSETTEFAIPSGSAVRLLESLSAYPNFRITLETGKVAYSNVAFEDYESIVCQDLAEVAKQEAVLKIIVGIDSEDTLESVKRELTDDLYYTVSCGHLLQIMSKKATKWNGVKQVLSHYNISPHEAVYFGDDNDAVADQLADSNDRDGVAKFITENIF